MKQAEQLSESLSVAALLALAGGFLDAYTYVARGGVFANAQTGNMVLLGVCLFEGNLRRAGGYLVPIFAFAAGVLTAEAVRRGFARHRIVHWRQIILVIETAALSFSALIPAEYNTAANVLISFVCALQAETFRKIGGRAFATTMCTGNLRSASELLWNFHVSGDGGALQSSLNYIMIILLFIAGAGVGALLSQLLGLAASLFPAFALIISATLMIDREQPRRFAAVKRWARGRLRNK